VAAAAARHGILYSLSTMGTTSLEDMDPTNAAAKIFQIYIFKDRGLTSELIARCKDAGYSGLTLTVDTPVAGNRERDVKSVTLDGQSLHLLEIGSISPTSVTRSTHWPRAR